MIIGVNHYSSSLDLAKGIGIILVILGHTLCPSHFLINVFHMPLFFFISGMTFHRSDKVRDFLIKKINRIIIPWLFFTSISILICLVIYRSPKSPSGWDFNAPLWFLQTLFVSLLVYVVLERKLKGYWLSIAVCLLSFIGYYTAKTGIAESFPWHIMRAFIALLFIHLRHMYNKLTGRKNLKKVNLIILAISFIVYVVSCYIAITHYSNCETYSFVNSDIYTFNVFLFLPASISGILIVVSVSVLFQSIKVINNMGKNSLIILCVHFPLIEYLNALAAESFLYTFSLGKVVLMFLIVFLIILWSYAFIWFSKKYIPQLTGYKNIL